jgi:hypothetical protein
MASLVSMTDEELAAELVNQGARTQEKLLTGLTRHTPAVTASELPAALTYVSVSRREHGNLIIRFARDCQHRCTLADIAHRGFRCSHKGGGCFGIRKKQALAYLLRISERLQAILHLAGVLCV